MQYTLRKATAADEKRINELFVEMLRTIYKKDDVDGYKEGDLDYYFAGKEDYICLAEVEGKTVGFLSIEVHRGEEPGDYLYYDDFSVTAEYRNLGIGTALSAEGERYAKSLGIDTIALHVEKENHAARRFYDRLGYTVFRDDGTRFCLIKHLA